MLKSTKQALESVKCKIVRAPLAVDAEFSAVDAMTAFQDLQSSEEWTSGDYGITPESDVLSEFLNCCAKEGAWRKSTKFEYRFYPE